MCGKNAKGTLTRRRMTGSPPRVREELRLAIRRIQRWGITPACAGRTRFKVGRIRRHRDHPRVCGKNPSFSCSSARRAGSPPRVREEHESYIPAVKYSRITPACAGRTVKKSPFYAFSFSSLFMNPFTFVTSSLKISTFVLLCCSVLSPIP